METEVLLAGSTVAPSGINGVGNRYRCICILFQVQDVSDFLLLYYKFYYFSSSSAHVSGLGDLNMPSFLQLAVKCDKN
ncbi:hypothetical protein Gotur_034369 [Gossypium turneri]